MFRAPAMLLPHESTVAHEQHFIAEVQSEDICFDEKKKVRNFVLNIVSVSV